MKTVQHTGRVQFTGFLNDREQLLATAQLRRLSWDGYTFFGGHKSAERRMLCVFEDNRNIVWPIACLRAAVRGDAGGLTHRDYLGALLGAGVRRDCVGDILPNADGATLFASAAVAGFLCEEVTEVGRCRVTVEDAGAFADADQPEPAVQAQALKKINVSSLRLDAVLAAMLKLSRADAAALIKTGRVQVNHLAVEDVHYTVQAQDVFSIRGRGKYRLGAVTGLSRKGRIWVEFQVY